MHSKWKSLLEAHRRRLRTDPLELPVPARGPRMLARISHQDDMKYEAFLDRESL